MENPEEEEGFAGVCRFCGTDCGGVSQLFDENAKLRLKKEQLHRMLTPANWDEVEFYVRAAAHNEDGPDHEITDQFYEDAVNELISEHRAAQKIMRLDHQKITSLEAQVAELRAKL